MAIWGSSWILHLFNATLSFVHHFAAIGEKFKPGVTVRKRSIWVTNRQFRFTWDVEVWWMTLKMNRVFLFCYVKLCPSFHCHMWIQTWIQIDFDLCDLALWSLTMTFCMDIIFVNDIKSWNLHDNTMRGTWWKRRHRQMVRRTDGQKCS